MRRDLYLENNKNCRRNIARRGHRCNTVCPTHGIICTVFTNSSLSTTVSYLRRYSRVTNDMCHRVNIYGNLSPSDTVSFSLRLYHISYPTIILLYTVRPHTGRRIRDAAQGTTHTGRHTHVTPVYRWNGTHQTKTKQNKTQCLMHPPCPLSLVIHLYHATRVRGAQRQAPWGGAVPTQTSGLHAHGVNASPPPSSRKIYIVIKNL